MRKLQISLPTICLFILFSCSSSDDEKDNRTIFSYNEMAGVTSLDPAAAISFENIWPVNQVFNGLVQM
nr:ABC transporter substrate-binding protein [Bacteroidota bacterium]